ncbi:hypothetical protein TH63_17580 [Rufibacter radiotolerans]|uniref:Uncharacterized protein n=1 Tax=Rufibacter radiotolerans TaxID=1379910 RepID=A0A0H4W9C0_9BACT|nr:hypothetical protein TH63_17580 [Rufibacter radiotolerans]
MLVYKNTEPALFGFLKARFQTLSACFRKTPAPFFCAKIQLLFLKTMQSIKMVAEFYYSLL